MGQAERGRERGVFLFDVTQAESESAHVNELENAIKNIYTLETVIQNFLRDAGYQVTSRIPYNQWHQLFSVINASQW